MQERFIKIGLISLINIGFILPPAHSQTITPDGTGTLIEYQGQTYRITGGTQAGANLFHSFQDFGLNAGQVAQFLSQPGIENIFGRVTGGNPSVIEGLLQVTGNNAHLYLMNPAGIVFGPGSRLDLSGNFTATTADRIGFEGGWFNAFGPNDYSGLTGNPQQLSFLQTTPGSIVNAGDLITSGNLYISAGTILNTGKIEGKHVILAAVPGQSLVQLAQPGMLLRLEVDRGGVEAGITALDLPELLTGTGLDLPVAVPPGSVVITNTVAGQTVDLMAAERVRPSDPKLIRTGDGTRQDPTVVLFPENLQDPLSVTMIDSRVDQPQDLLYGGNSGTISRVIPPDAEGVGAISATLERVTTPIDKLKIVAEGHEGNIWLGQTWLNADNIQDYQGALGEWGEQLGPNAALLIYSCFTALGAIGEGFVNSIADFTGATVAASTNVTGSANYGGDWNLEYRTGNVDVGIPFTPETLSNWDGKLATLTVTTSLDDPFFTGSLRQRIRVAQAGDTVRFDRVRTVTLKFGEIAWATDNLTIDGNGSTVSGNNESRVFNITAAVPTTFENITITGGNPQNEHRATGGGISSQGPVTLNNSTISENSSFGGGGITAVGNVIVKNSTISDNSAYLTGGIFITGSNSRLTLNNSTVSGNSSYRGGGGISGFFSGEVILNDSTVSGNSTNLYGGGILNISSSLTLNNSTVSGNSAGNHAGGISASSTLILNNSTVSGNSANIGGGISSRGTVTLNNSTIALNTATSSGGGISLQNDNTHTFTNSIIANNTAPTGPDIAIESGNPVFNISHSLILDTNGMDQNGTIGIPVDGVNGNIVGIDPQLAPLADNEGTTQTHALLPGSPAINAGDNALTTTTLDQRGKPRIFEEIVDMGAYEVQALTPELPPEPPPIDPIIDPEPPPTDPIISPEPPSTDPVIAPEPALEKPVNPLKPTPEDPPTTSPTLETQTVCFPNCEPEEKAELAIKFTEQLQTDSPERSLFDVGLAEIETQITQEYQNYLDLDPVPDMTLTEAQTMLQRITQQTGQTPAILYITFVPVGLETSEDFTRSLLASATLDDPFPLAQRSIVPAETDELQLVLVTPTGTPILKRLRVNRRQVTRTTAQLARAMARPSGAGYLQPAQELYNWLIAPLRSELAEYHIDHLGIIADTGLRFIPFAALHDGAQFLIEQYSVGLMPSLSLTEHTYQPLQGLPVLAMGASEFTAQAPLPAVPLELSMITEQIGTSEKLINEDFTLQQLRAARDRLPYPIIHLGTHGEFNPGSPADSYIELWGDRLTLDRIRELGLNNPPVELLVLSACRTALGSNEAELGFAGFAVQAGVKSVLGSLWYVSDLGTLGLMSAFYEQLQTAPIKAEALRQAQLAMVRGEIYLDGVSLVSGAQNIPLTPELVALAQVNLSHPYYWSAFTLIGSPW